MINKMKMMILIMIPEHHDQEKRGECYQQNIQKIKEKNYHMVEKNHLQVCKIYAKYI